MTNETFQWFPERLNQPERPLSTEFDSHLDGIQTDALPAEEGKDVAVTLKNVANTYEYLRSLGFSDETLGPLANTYHYLTDISNRNTTELLEDPQLVREAKTKPLVIQDAFFEEH